MRGCQYQGTPIDQQIGKMMLYGFKAWLAFSHLLPGRPMFRWTAKSKAISHEARDFAMNSMLGIGKRQFLWIVGGMLNAEKIIVPHGVTQPMLITHGDHEMPKFVEKVCRKWHKSVDSSSYFVIPNAGHTGNQDNPDAFNKALEQFMEPL
jgi:pimeloyl-ACP methyl ester carboxylesterase